MRPPSGATPASPALAGCRLTPGARAAVACAFLLAASAPARSAAAVSPAPRDAVLVNVTERDLNRILRGVFHELGGPLLEGEKATLSRGIHDLRYRAELSEPRLVLRDEGGASLQLRVREASVRVGRLERRIGRRLVSCEDAGVEVEPDRPLDFGLLLRLAVRDGALEIVPEHAWVSDPKHRFHLVRPSSCRNTFLPRWLLWWLGKIEIERRLAGIEADLLAAARRTAAEISERRGLLRWSWRARGGAGGGAEDLVLHPTGLETRGRSLLLTLATSKGGPAATGGPPPGWTRELSGETYVAVPGSFLEGLLEGALRGLSASPIGPRGDLRKVFRSGSVYALIPGLRSLGRAQDVGLTVELHSAPRVELRRTSAQAARRSPRGGSGEGGGRPAIHIALRDVEIGLWKSASRGESTRLGTLVVESAAVLLAPYVNLLGGFSFEPLENAWRVRSHGIAADEEALGATLQEIVFGEVFETGFEPLARRAFRVGPTEFRPRSLRMVDDYLVVGFEEG